MPRFGLLYFLLSLFLFPPHLVAQTRVTEIREAHGGAAGIDSVTRYRMQGSLTRGGLVSRFVLEVEGDASRFENGEKIVIRQEAIVQYLKPDGSWSSPRTGWEGLREVYLLPIASLQQLPDLYRFEGSRATREDFAREIDRKTHLGYHARTPRAELAFDNVSRLLAEAHFSTLEQNQSEVQIRYLAYKNFSGLQLPSLVERTAGDTEPWIFHIESIDFTPHFTTGHFDFQ